MLASDEHAPAGRPTPLVLSLLAILLAEPSSLWAQARWMSNGVPVCVAPSCFGHAPMVCSDGKLGVLIAWQRDRTGNDENIYVQRVLSSGAVAPGWPAIGTAATTATRDQYLTDIAPDGQDGAFLVWWDWPNYDIYAQHVLGSGVIAPGWPANGLPVCIAPGQQIAPQLLADGGGGMYIVWGDERVSHAERDIYGLHVNGDGTRVSGWPENGLAICTAPAGQAYPYLVSDGQGGFIAVWSDGRDGVAEIFAERMVWSGEVAAGWPVNGQRIIADDGGGPIYGVVPDAAGGAYIGWRSGHDPNLSDWEVYAVRIVADGSVAPGWPASGYRLSSGQGHKQLISVVADSAGGVLLGWYDSYLQPSAALAQRLRPAGTIAMGWPASGAAVSDVAGFQLEPHLAPDGHGGVYVALETDLSSGQHGFVQHLGTDGAPALGWPTTGVPMVFPTIFFAFQQTEFAITPDGVGGVIVAWNDTRVYNGNGIQNQIYAQRYFGDGPTPAMVSLASAEALPDRVTLTWYDAARTLALATVYRRRDGEEWGALGSATFDGTGRLQYEDRDVAPGARYAYRVGWSESGAEHFSAENWVDVPVSLVLALEGARPNPAVGPLTVAFTLPRAAPATLALLDVSGRQVLEREVGDLGPGRHVLHLGECGCTPPGMYWVRLAQAGRSLVKRAAVIR